MLVHRCGRGDQVGEHEPTNEDNHASVDDENDAISSKTVPPSVQERLTAAEPNASTAATYAGTRVERGSIKNDCPLVCTSCARPRVDFRALVREP